MTEVTDLIDLTTDEVLEDSTDDDLVFEQHGAYVSYSSDFLELMGELEQMLRQLLESPCPPLLKEPYLFAIHLYSPQGPLRAQGVACVSKTCIYHMYQLQVGLDGFMAAAESATIFPGDKFRAFYEAVRAALLYAQRVFDETNVHGQRVRSWLAYLDASVSTPATFRFRDVKFLAPHHHHVPLWTRGIVSK